jgi:hypothetical protein
MNVSVLLCEEQRAAILGLNSGARSVLMGCDDDAAELGGSAFVQVVGAETALEPT